MSRNLIEFHTTHPDQIPAPYPATRSVPQWLKDMQMEHTGQWQGPTGPVTGLFATVKQCPPFIEAMTCGYVIPLPGDVTFTLDAAGELEFRSLGNFIDTQHPLEVRGSPVERSLIVKFMNPWIVKTPPGYSTLFVQPMNQFEFPFQVLSGLVETDTYYRPVAFPSICLMRPGMTVTLKRGTPIAQAIPIKREDWHGQPGAADATVREQVEREMRAERHNFYKDRYWKKKSYT